MRSVKPWVGRTDDTTPPPRVRLRIFLRYEGKCQLTGREIRPSDRWDLDHRVALVEGGANAEDNLWPVLAEAHKAKTAAEVALKAKVDATAKRHLGMKSRGPLAGADADERTARRAARSADRRGDRLGVPPRRIWPGFVSASD